MKGISVMLPSRNRPTELKTCIDSLGLNKQENIEVLIWVDTDDPQLQKYQELFGSNPKIRLFVKDRVGYIKFQIMLNFLSSQAKYDWIFEFNDDAYMDNPDWFNVVMDFTKKFDPVNQPVVLNIWGQGEIVYNLFPVVSKAYVTTLGHFAMTPNCDDWVRIVSLGAGISHNVMGIKPKHRKYGGAEDTLKDETYVDVERDRREHKKVWNEKRKMLPQEQIDKDIAALKEQRDKTYPKSS